MTSSCVSRFDIKSPCLWDLSQTGAMAEVHCLLRHSFSVGAGIECYSFKPHVPVIGDNTVRVMFPHVLVNGVDAVRAITGREAAGRFSKWASIPHIKNLAMSIQKITTTPSIVMDKDESGWITPALLWSLVGFVLPEFTAGREMELASYGNADPFSLVAEMRVYMRQMEQTHDNVLKNVMETEKRYISMMESIRTNLPVSNTQSEEVQKVVSAHADLFATEIKARRSELDFKLCIDACVMADKIMQHMKKTGIANVTEEMQEKVGNALKDMLMSSLERTPSEHWKYDSSFRLDFPLDLTNMGFDV
eukprot:jgi/Mesvir1/26725/Mv20502-RA.1